MKQHVADQLKLRAESGRPEPKIVYRFGDVHMMCGYTPFDQLDLGNQAAEVAALRGGGSFHVRVLAHRMIDLDGVEQDLTANQPGLMPLFEAAPDDEAVVFDLRSMRPLMSSRTFTQRFAELHGLGLGYDAVVVLPAFHADESLHPMPGAN